jgi:hypothetical protein
MFEALGRRDEAMRYCIGLSQFSACMPCSLNAALQRTKWHARRVPLRSPVPLQPVDDDILTSDKAGLRRGEKCHDFGYIARGANAL